MIYESAGILRQDPRHFTFHELMLMRRGFEEEEWDRLSFLLTNVAMIGGAKDAKLEKFHKFKMPDTRMTKAKFAHLKGMFQNG